jgi:hypothetical protein
MSSTRCKTQILKAAVDPKIATHIYEHLRDTTEWEESIRSRKKGNAFTRNGKAINLIEYPELLEIISEVILKFKTGKLYQILGVYLNYYENGDIYTSKLSFSDS